jgi:hypothetical protein
MRGWRIVLASAGCGAILLAAVLLGTLLAPAPATLEEAAAIALRAEGIRFQRVSIKTVGCIPAPENCQSYSGDIIVMGEQPARGRDPMPAHAPG